MIKTNGVKPRDKPGRDNTEIHSFAIQGGQEQMMDRYAILIYFVENILRIVRSFIIGYTMHRIIILFSSTKYKLGKKIF